ncbi:hypothetical protein [Citrobacter sp. JGM124]|uniref:hypothetical protein n=1 Tax=Citrobacter sp. JGM124 TaxID=2799789 RepID=UPI001BABB473|nr:hypothetical protein [Citrobacter sp. JGM124]MBS0849529.1 hypothetical protein [Citrobacter sp. JGM124]
MRKFHILPFLCLYAFISPAEALAYTYTCTSSFEHQIKLDSTSEVYPSVGTVYPIDFSNQGNYSATCDVPTSGQTEKKPTLYKAVYGGGEQADSDGYITLNDFVKVRSYIKVYNSGDVQVPFTDVSNKAAEIPKASTSVTSGSSGKVEILIRKSILQGVIPIPEFYVYLYSRYEGYSDAYNSEPLSIVHFNASSLEVDKVCDVSGLPFSESIKNQSLSELVNNTDSMGVVSFTISCTKDVSELDLNLSFSGEAYKSDPRFFKSDVSSIGIGLYNDNGEYTYGENGFPLSLSNSQATVSFKMVPVAQDEKTEVNAAVKFNIQPVIYGNK